MKLVIVNLVKINVTRIRKKEKREREIKKKINGRIKLFIRCQFQIGTSFIISNIKIEF